MAISLTLSPFMMSVSQFLLLIVWLFMGDPVKVKFQRFIHNCLAKVFHTFIQDLGDIGTAKVTIESIFVD